jgi:hypothetical protein
MTPKPHPGVSVDVRVGEELTLDLAALGLSLGTIRVLVERKDGQRARLRVVADARIKVSRPPRAILAKAG